MHSWPDHHHELILIGVFLPLFLYEFRVQWSRFTKHIVFEHIDLLFVVGLSDGAGYFIGLVFWVGYIKPIILTFIPEQFKLNKLSNFLFVLIYANFTVTIFDYSCSIECFNRLSNLLVCGVDFNITTNLLHLLFDGLGWLDNEGSVCIKHGVDVHYFNSTVQVHRLSLFGCFFILLFDIGSQNPSETLQMSDVGLVNKHYLANVGSLGYLLTLEYLILELTLTLSVVDQNQGLLLALAQHFY